MNLILTRYSSQNNDTLGLLHLVTEKGREFLGYTIEDEKRTVKVFGETRIPDGTYKIKLRTTGGFHSKYSQKFKDMHKGMLHLQDVPNFTYVLVHIGNSSEDSAGCILVGDSAHQNITKPGFIGDSTAAYKRIYPLIAEELSKGNPVEITILTLF